MIHKVPRDLEFSDEEKFTTISNHNQFIRSTIVTVINLILISLLATGITFLIIFICSLINASSTGGSSAATGISVVLTIAIYIAYGIYFWNSLSKLTSLHKQITEIEDSVFEIYTEQEESSADDEEDDEEDDYTRTPEEDDAENDEDEEDTF